MTVGESIKKYRKEQKLTQKELGSICGLSEAMIRQYELGIRNPKIETLEKIADALNVPIMKISKLNWDDYKKTSDFKRIERRGNAIEGIVSILSDLYGNAEEIWVNGKYGDSLYYLIGEEKEQFILYEGHIDILYDFIKASLPYIINEMKEIRPVSEIHEEILKELNDYELLPEELKEIVKKNDKE